MLIGSQSVESCSTALTTCPLRTGESGAVPLHLLLIRRLFRCIKEMSDDESAAGGAGAAASADKKAGPVHHYAWASETQKRRDELAALGVPTGPTKLSEGDSLPASAPPLVAGGSAWNAAGTFEERDVSVRARALLSEIALARTIKLGGAGALHARVTAVDKCDGPVHVVFARGKTRAGYELNVAMTLEVHSEASAAAGLPAVSTGSASFDEVSDSEGSDFFGSWSVDVTAHDDVLAGGVSRDAVRKLVRDRVGDFRDIFKTWVEAVKKL